jgi:hypothetical protein
MNLRADGQTRGSADDGFSSAAHATCPRFTATSYGILLQKINPPHQYDGKYNALSSQTFASAFQAAGVMPWPTLV